jgi:tRNA-(ms[2]io[6]A)-hydroxylase
MLGLKLATDPRWANAAEMSLEEILTDHAYCEQKAASSAISLIVKISQETPLVADLTDLVAEEWGHFRRVMKELSKRGLKLGLHRKDRYVAEIKKLIRDEGSWQQNSCEKLLLFALIEARSCERFRCFRCMWPMKTCANSTMSLW